MALYENVVPTDSRYIPLTQQVWCCVPTCFQMVMLRHKIPLLPVELMGSYLGLLVPEKDKDLFYDVKTGPKPKGGYGTQGQEKELSNEMFERLKIPLKMDWQLIDNFKDVDAVRNYLQKVVSSDKDVLVCFEYGRLFGSWYQSLLFWDKSGHVCLIDKVDLNKNEIRLVDSEQDAPKWRIVKIDKLFLAMKVHGPENSAGFWELSVTSK